MNDIEVLEKRKDMLQERIVIALDNPQTKKSYIEEMSREKQAIENLLKERQSDKERIKELTLNDKEKEIIETYRNLIKETGIESWVICNPETMWCNYFVPKSLIKEKIEEKQKRINKMHPASDCVLIDDLENQIQVLEELLKGE